MRVSSNPGLTVGQRERITEMNFEKLLKWDLKNQQLATWQQEQQQEQKQLRISKGIWAANPNGQPTPPEKPGSPPSAGQEGSGSSVTTFSKGAIPILRINSSTAFTHQEGFACGQQGHFRWDTGSWTVIIGRPGQLIIGLGRGGREQPDFSQGAASGAGR